MLLALAVGHRPVVDFGADQLLEDDVVQGQRARRRTLGAFPGQGRVPGQALDDLREQELAPADGGEQPVQANHQHQPQRAGHQYRAQGEVAQAGLPLAAQLGDVGLALLGRRLAGLAAAEAEPPARRHQRSAPTLR